MTGVRGGVALPDTFIIGAPKAGTTSLARWLASHPDVYFSVPKEPYFWATDFPRLREHLGFDSLAAYEALFANPEAATALRRAEGSTIYLYSRSAVEDIATAVDDPRFVLALRDPVDLVVSLHRTQLLALNEDEPSFELAWRRSLRGGLPNTDPLDPKLVDYPHIGALGAAVSRLLRTVPLSRLQVVSFEQLNRDPRRVWRELTGFLGLDERPLPDFSVHNASNKTYRWRGVQRLKQRPPPGFVGLIRHARQWSRTTSVPVFAKAKRQLWRPAPRPTISAELRAELTEYFREDTRLLHQSLHLDGRARI